MSAARSALTARAPNPKPSRSRRVKTPGRQTEATGLTTARSAIRRRLLAWYRRSHRDMPWRDTSDPYRIWLSEIMLQQTRVESVIPYYLRFLTAFPDVQTLVASPIDEVLRLWAGLGYYSRARNMHAAAKVVLDRFGGSFPTSVDELLTLPGIGRYTASAIASIAFGARAAVLDGNVKRVLARLFAVRGDIRTPGTTDELWEIAESLVSPKYPGDFNQAMMELGATVCTPSSPRCGICPVRELCVANQRGLQDELPVVGKKAAPRPIHAVAAAIFDGESVLMVQRPAAGLLGGLWELPGGEWPQDRDPEEALSAALHRDFGLTVAVGEALGEIEHLFTHRRLRLRVFACGRWQGSVRLARHIAALWIGRRDWDSVAIATVDRKALSLVESQLPQRTASKRAR